MSKTMEDVVMALYDDSKDVSERMLKILDKESIAVSVAASTRALAIVLAALPDKVRATIVDGLKERIGNIVSGYADSMERGDV